MVDCSYVIHMLFVFCLYVVCKSVCMLVYCLSVFECCVCVYVLCMLFVVVCMLFVCCLYVVCMLFVCCLYVVENLVGQLSCFKIYLEIK